MTREPARGEGLAGTDPVLDSLIAGNDLDELVREVDRRTGANDWPGLLRLRDRCQSALERGFQLWPVASLAEYRLALRSPGKWAARITREGAGRFALGPLSEVAASTHAWSELAPHLQPGPLAGVCAHERVVRGEDLSRVDVPFGDVFDLPLVLEPWEPRWPVATYSDNEIHAPRPGLPTLCAAPLSKPGERLDDPEAEAALLAVVSSWTSQSNGRAEVSCVRGAALAAAVMLGSGEMHAAELEAGEALVQLAWAGASGGAHGRRRGAATGRNLAWGCAEVLGGVDAVSALHWFAWDDTAVPELGWSLRLAVENPGEGVSWALSASDRS
ncbi:MAG: hypothetical protein ACRDV9_07915 [Acidimicrobiia bacterium]